MADSDANAISDRIHDRHLVYGFIAETQFTSPQSAEILWTNGNGDGAIWTGTYLAAEAFRYKVTGSSTAWNYLHDALASVRVLSYVAPSGFLARTVFPLDSPFIEHLIAAEGRLGLFRTSYHGKDSYWVGHPTRDQYSGVFLGLRVAYELIDDAEVRSICRDVITHLVDGLIAHAWVMGNPEQPVQETYLYRPDQLLSVLQLATRVNPERFASANRWTRFFLSPLVGIPLALDCLDRHNNYYKFNLDYSYCYNLITLENDRRYRRQYLKQYARLRNATRSHGNATFNMIDRAISGPDAARDQETVALLDSLLKRGFRNVFVDLSGKYAACGPDRACHPIPVIDRPYADYLWQRTPFAMKCDGDGSVESPGIDYILPYWMAKYYGVL